MCRNKWLSSCMLVVAATLFASGCTSMRVVAPVPGAVLPADVAVGKTIRVRDRDESSIELKVTAIGPDYVEGRTRDGLVRIGFRDVREVRERRFAPGRTVALAVGMLYVAYAAATVSLLNAAAGGL
jgi:hypothetical protein